MQLTLLDEPCLSCGSLVVVNVLESATFTGEDCRLYTTAVSVEWDCAACGSRVLTIRKQPSRWIERVWG